MTLAAVPVSQCFSGRHSAELKEAKGNVARLRRWSEEQLQATVRTHTQEHLKLQALLEDQLVERSPPVVRFF